jgi:hypothetical protein
LALFCGNPSERKSAAEFHPYCAFHQQRACTGLPQRKTPQRRAIPQFISEEAFA